MLPHTPSVPIHFEWGHNNTINVASAVNKDATAPATASRALHATYHFCIRQAL